MDVGKLYAHSLGYGDIVPTTQVYVYLRTVLLYRTTLLSLLIAHAFVCACYSELQMETAKHK